MDIGHVYDLDLAKEKIPLAIEHQRKTGHKRFAEQIFSSNGRLSAKTRMALRCLTCDEVLDIRGERE